VRGGRWAALAGVAAWGGYAWGAQAALPLVACRRGQPGARRVALTFDDGPDPEWTPRLLRLLDRRRVRATFFLIGARAARHPAIVRALAAGGHEIGNHTWRHRHAWLLRPAAALAEVRQGARILGDIAGQRPSLFRPPWGLVNAATLWAARREHRAIVLWSIQPEGLRARSPETQLAHVKRRLHDGAIIDLHDAPGVPGAPARLLGMLPALLDLLDDEGYVPAPAGALLAMPDGTGPPAGPRNTLGALSPVG
jgi:peptidoglycan/xylan/chitin deacetylase (PgdA/CDA1 family)